MPRPLVSTADVPLKPRIFQVVVRVADMDRAEAFYSRVLGMELRAVMDPTPEIKERFYGYESEPNETLLCLVQFLNAPPAPRSRAIEDTLFHVTVPNLQRVLDQVAAAGGAIVSGPNRRQMGPLTMDAAFIADPDGTMMMLTQFQ